MAVNTSPKTLGSGFKTSTINENFQDVKTSLADALSRSGDGPNQMEADIDLNSNDLLNVKDIYADTVTVGGVDITAQAAQAAASAAAALVSEGNAAVSESNAAVSEANASVSEDNAAASAAAASAAVSLDLLNTDILTFDQTLTNDVTLISGKNGLAAWDTIDTGVTVSVVDGTLTIIN